MLSTRLWRVSVWLRRYVPTLAHDHIDHCLEPIVREESRSVGYVLHEIKEITQYL